jgi:tetratricopeptide (TPR) repeat protein
MSRLEQFLTTDTRSRDRAALFSAGVGLGFGLLARLLGCPFEVSAYGTAAFVFGVYVFQAWLYCHMPAESRSASRLMERRWCLAAAGLAAVILAILPEQTVEAAVYDRRLRVLTRNPLLSPGEAKAVDATLERIEKLHIDLPLTTKTQVRDAVKISALQKPEPPFTDAASTFVKYVRSAPIPAQIAMDAAAREVLLAVKSGDRWPLYSVDRTAVESAITKISDALQLSGSSNKNLTVAALLSRAELKELLFEHDAALADAEAAERAGAVDLSEVIDVESLAFVNRGIEKGQREDLMRALRLLTLKLQLPPPSLIANKESEVLLNKLGTFDNLSRANYALGNFDAAIQNARQALNILHKVPGMSDEYYQIGLRIFCLTIVASSLRQGDFQGALSAAVELERESNGHADVVRLVNDLQQQPPNTQFILANIDTYLRVKPLQGQ